MNLTIDNFGRILIPKAIRQSLNLQAGDEVNVELDSSQGVLKLSVMPKPSDVKVEYTDWGFPIITGGNPLPKDFDTVEFIKQGYEEYHKRRFGV